MIASDQLNSANDNSSSSDDDNDVVAQALELDNRKIRYRPPNRTRRFASKTVNTIPASSVVENVTTTNNNTYNTIMESTPMDIAIEPAARHATPSTDGSPRKRLRFAETVAPINLTPFTSAFDQKLTPHEVTLSLPAAIRPLARHYATEFKKLCNRRWELLNKKSKLEAGGFVPNSLRSDFELGASDAFQEAYKLEYDSAVLEAKVVLDTYQKSVISSMTDILELELKILNPKIDELFCRAANKMAHTLILLNNFDVIDVSVLVYLTFDHYSTTLLKPTSMSFVFFEKYKE